MVRKSKLFRTKFHLRLAPCYFTSAKSLGFIGKILDVEDFSHSGEPLGTSLDQFYPSLHYKISRFLVENQRRNSDFSRGGDFFSAQSEPHWHLFLDFNRLNHPQDLQARFVVPFLSILWVSSRRIHF